ncbi:hypothetical protein PVK06_030883 [Gossypium arboreum]|uniref:Uncharacterized protein n=1 Tax=Gossypium arboreum TaxID=29729 RepID=A0ABR0NPH7_GOSAR|nr:hypothetical protein PVK06_030883 [Gossypium arboreum]
MRLKYDAELVANLSATVFSQQDHLLTSWLLSTTGSSFLSSFTDVCTACDVWSIVNSLFATDKGAKQSRICHKLHSLKKEAEKTEIMFLGLPSEFDTVVSSASLSPTPLPFQWLVDALIKCESRQARAIQEVLFVANLVESAPSQPVENTARGGCLPSCGRGRSFRPRL